MIQLQAINQIREATSINRQLQQRLPLSTKNRLALEKKSLAQLDKVCQLLAPETALKRGFSITTINGKVVSKKNQVKKGDILVTQLLKDSFKSTVK